MKAVRAGHADWSALSDEDAFLWAKRSTAPNIGGNNQPAAAPGLPNGQVLGRGCADFATDAQPLWRRPVFNLLINHVDDGLHKIGFLYVGGMKWQLAPANGMSPEPARERASPMSPTTRTGKARSMRVLLDHAEAFELTIPEALEVLAEITSVIKIWREVAGASPVDLYGQPKNRLGPAFEHAQLKEAIALCA